MPQRTRAVGQRRRAACACSVGARPVAYIGLRHGGQRNRSVPSRTLANRGASHANTSASTPPAPATLIRDTRRCTASNSGFASARDAVTPGAPATPREVRSLLGHALRAHGLVGSGLVAPSPPAAPLGREAARTAAGDAPPPLGCPPPAAASPVAAPRRRRVRGREAVGRRHEGVCARATGCGGRSSEHPPTAHSGGEFGGGERCGERAGSDALKAQLCARQLAGAAAAPRVCAQARAARVASRARRAWKRFGACLRPSRRAGQRLTAQGAE